MAIRELDTSVSWVLQHTSSFHLLYFYRIMTCTIMHFILLILHMLPLSLSILFTRNKDDNKWNLEQGESPDPTCHTQLQHTCACFVSFTPPLLFHEK